MGEQKRIKVPISDELRQTARRWNDLLDGLPSKGVLEITAENLEQFQAAFQRAGVTNDDVDRLQLLLIRFEKDAGEKEFNFEHWGHCVSRLRADQQEGPESRLGISKCW